MVDIVRSFYNIEEYGAVQGTLINTILQNAVNFADHKTTIYIPSKYYYIDQTINFPSTFGGTIYGAGFGLNGSNFTSTTQGRGPARIIWTGAKNKPMFKISGANVTFEGGLTLVGKKTVSIAAANKASIGILVTNTGPVSGNLNFNAITIAHCDTAFQVGETSEENYNSNLFFTFFNYSNSETAYKIVSQQSRRHTFEFLHGDKNTCIRVFQIYGGSLINVMGGLSFNNIFFEIPASANIDHNSIFRCDNLKTDSQSGSAFKAIKCYKPASGAKFIFNNLFIAYDDFVADNAYCFDLYGKLNLTLRDCYNIQRGMIRSIKHAEGRPNVALHRLKMSPLATLSELFYSDTNGYYATVNNCVNSLGAIGTEYNNVYYDA